MVLRLGVVQFGPEKELGSSVEPELGSSAPGGEELSWQSWYERLDEHMGSIVFLG